MKHLITTKQHAKIDYIWSIAMPLLPWLIGAGPGAKKAMRAASGIGAAETAMTDFEGGMKGLLPMQGHLAMDAVLGVGLIGTALFLKNESPLVRGFLAGAGLFAIAAATLTEPIPHGAGKAHAKETARKMKEHSARLGRIAGSN
jgi:hypothetical protein